MAATTTINHKMFLARALRGKHNKGKFVSIRERDNKRRRSVPGVCGGGGEPRAVLLFVIVIYIYIIFSKTLRVYIHYVLIFLL